MTIKAVFFDFGGVIGRTVDSGPRQRQADRLGISLKPLAEAVFFCESARRATLGEISESAHWVDVMHGLGLPEEQAPSFSSEFFSGDQLDQALLAFIRSLRPAYRTGLISNAWSGLRGYIVQEKFEDAFDEMIISAEVGIAKPDPAIFHLALERFGVQPAEAVFVDDFIENIEAARTTGLFAIHFTQPEAAVDELKKLLTDHK